MASGSRPKAPIQCGLWPSKNMNVAHYKRQDLSVEERIKRDIKNEKKSRKRAEKDS